MAAQTVGHFTEERWPHKPLHQVRSHQPGKGALLAARLPKALQSSDKVSGAPRVRPSGHPRDRLRGWVGGNPRHNFAHDVIRHEVNDILRVLRNDREAILEEAL